MDPNKFTAKVNEIISGARDLALENQHQQLAIIHGQYRTSLPESCMEGPGLLAG